MTDRYPYRHHGPAVHGSKLADYLISEANMIEDIEQLRAANARLAEALVDAMIVPEAWMISGRPIGISDEAWAQIQRSVHFARAALSADPAPVGDAWQPIETAPRDGTRFLAFERWNADYQIYECWWGEDFGNWEGWRDAWDSEPEPSHWMPLPPPPAGENGND